MDDVAPCRKVGDLGPGFVLTLRMERIPDVFARAASLGHRGRGKLAVRSYLERLGVRPGETHPHVIAFNPQVESSSEMAGEDRAGATTFTPMPTIAEINESSVGNGGNRLIQCLRVLANRV